MIGPIAVVTDSASYLPEQVRLRFGIHVVPLTVTVDGREYREGIDLDADLFYPMLEKATAVTTSQPSPGIILESYRAAAAEGAKSIISIHIGAALSGTLQSARLAASMSPIPVTVIDSGQASFAEGLVVWEVIDALDQGVDAGRAPDIAREASARVGNTFVVKALDLMRRGGRLEQGAHADAIPVLAYSNGAVRVSGNAETSDRAVAIMADTIRDAAAAARYRLRVGIGHGAAEPIARELRRHVCVMPGVAEVIDYVVGPSIGAHTGAGTAGAVFIERVRYEV
jgi:DegV family protein with EDD domain